MAEKYLIKYLIADLNSEFYLKKTLFKGYETTNKTIDALKCNTEEEARKHIEKQTAFNPNSLTIEKIIFH